MTKQLKTMTQLCESIMDDLEVQQTNSSAAIANASKMEKRSVEDYPYKMTFIMWEDHILYKGRQKIKKDVILYLLLNPLIKEFSEVKFDVDRDAADTTLYLGFEHKIRTVSLFYRLFTGIVGYLLLHMNIVDYEFVIKDNVEKRELCRIDNSDFELFKLLKTEHRYNDYEDALKRLKWFKDACEEFLGISEESAIKQVENLFDIRFEKDPKYDSINKMYLNENMNISESVMDDLSRDERPASLKLADLIAERYLKVRNAVLSLLTTMKRVDKIVDNLKNISAEDKKCFHIYGKLYASTDPDAETYYFNSDLNQEEIIDMCQFLYNSYSYTVDSEFQWIFDESEHMDEFYDKLEKLFDELEDKYRNDRHKSVTLLSELDMNYMEFNNYQPVKLINEMKKWVNQVYKPFILANFSDSAVSETLTINEDRRALYESIMSEVAQIIKKHLNESSSSNSIWDASISEDTISHLMFGVSLQELEQSEYDEVLQKMSEIKQYVSLNMSRLDADNITVDMTGDLILFENINEANLLDFADFLVTILNDTGEAYISDFESCIDYNDILDTLENSDLNLYNLFNKLIDDTLFF